MGMGVVPVIGSIITSVVVSKAVSAVGEKIGLSEDMTSLIGTVAGVAAGGYTYSAATSAAAGAGSAAAGGVDLSLPTGAADLSIGGAATPAPVPSAVPSLSIGSAPGAQNALSMTGAAPQAARGGMLSMPESAPAPSMGGPKTTAPPQTGDTASRMIESGTTPQAPPTEKSWVERLFSPEKTMDLVMAGMSGYGKAGIAKEQMEYPEKVAEKNARGWASAYPGQLSLKQPSFPTQE